MKEVGRAQEAQEKNGYEGIGSRPNVSNNTKLHAATTLRSPAPHTPQCYAITLPVFTLSFTLTMEPSLHTLSLSLPRSVPL